MDKNEVIEKLSSYIKEDILKKSKKEINADEPIISSGIIDSFSLVDLALFIEETYDVQIDDAELNADTFDTIDQLSEIILDRNSSL